MSPPKVVIDKYVRFYRNKVLFFLSSMKKAKNNPLLKYQLGLLRRKAAHSYYHAIRRSNYEKYTACDTLIQSILSSQPSKLFTHIK